MASDIRTDYGSAASRVDAQIAKRPKVPRKVDVAVGARIKKRRKALGLSQTELGRKLGITFQQIQKYEKGTNRIGASRLALLAAALHMPIGDLFGEDTQGLSDSHQDNAVSVFLEHGDGKRLFLAFTRIKNKNARKGIVRLVESLADRSQRDSPHAAV